MRVEQETRLQASKYCSTVWGMGTAGTVLSCQRSQLQLGQWAGTATFVSFRPANFKFQSILRAYVLLSLLDHWSCLAITQIQVSL